MYCEFLEDAGRRGDRIRSAEKREVRLLRCCEEAPGCGLVSCYISICTFWLVCRLNIIGVRNRLDVGGVVVAVLKDLLVRGDQLRFLLSELALEVLEDVLHRTVVDVAGHSEGEHILTFLYCLLVQAAVLETLFCESRDRCDDDGSVLDVELCNRIALQTCPLETFLIEGVRVDQHHSCPLEPLGVSFERSRVHRHKKVAEIARCGDVFAADVYLEAGNS